jgi:hypothetical protein
MLNPDFITISTVSMPLLKHVILSRTVGLQFWAELQNPIIKLWKNIFLLRFEGLWWVLTFQPNEVWDMTHVGVIIADYVWKDSHVTWHIFSYDGNQISNLSSSSFSGRPWQTTDVYCSLLAYCTARFRRSNFGHEMPPRLSTRSTLQRRKLELMGILPRMPTPSYI